MEYEGGEARPSRRRSAVDAARPTAACGGKGEGVSMCSGRGAGARGAAARARLGSAEGRGRGVLRAASPGFRRLKPGDYDDFVALCGPSRPSTRPRPAASPAQALRSLRARPYWGWAVWAGERRRRRVVVDRSRRGDYANPFVRLRRPKVARSCTTPLRANRHINSWSLAIAHSALPNVVFALRNHDAVLRLA